MNPKIKAEAVIRALCIESPDDIEIELIANYFNVHVKRKRLEGAAARLTLINNAACITISNAEQNLPSV